MRYYVNLIKNYTKARILCILPPPLIYKYELMKYRLHNIANKSLIFMFSSVLCNVTKRLDYTIVGTHPGMFIVIIVLPRRGIICYFCPDIL